MSEAAQNLMTDDGGSWKEALAGDNQEVLEQLSTYESPSKFLEEFNNLRNADWRDGFAAGDDKFKSQLERFKSPADLGNAFREAQQKIRSGQFKDPLPEGATDAEIQAYRQQHGIPEKPEGYLENLPDGMVIGEDDKDIMLDFLGSLHKANADPKIAQQAIEWYNSFKETTQEQLAAADQEQQHNAEDFLRREWGADYRTNVNIIGAMIEKTFGADVRDSLLNARDHEGRAIMNIPGIMEGFATLARSTMHPMAIPGQTGDPVQAVEDEIRDIEKVMKENRAQYNKDETMQARLRELYDIRLKHSR
jgi:hypothetical protein